MRGKHTAGPFSIPTRHTRHDRSAPGDRRYGLAISIVAAIASAAIMTSAALADDVPAGIDLFQTPPGGSWTDEFNSGAGGSPIPADFFDPGSDPFDGRINLEGDPFPFTGNGDCLAPADTIVERLADAPLPVCPSAAPVPIEIVALSLVSSAPITVTFNGGLNPEQWDVKVCLSDAPQDIGQMIIQHDCPDGGTFTSDLPVKPKLIFTRQSDNAVRILDPAIDFGAPATLFSAFGGWVHQSTISQVTQVGPGAEVDGNCDGNIETLAAGTSNFVPGILPAPCDCTVLPGDSMQTKELTPEQAMLAEHGVLPAQDPPDNDGDGIPDDCVPGPKVVFPKWTQLPHPNGQGFNVASDIDWQVLADQVPNDPGPGPNWVVADDFQSDGRPISCVRWWGSYLDPTFEPAPAAGAPERSDSLKIPPGGGAHSNDLQPGSIVLPKAGQPSHGPGGSKRESDVAPPRAPVVIPGAVAAYVTFDEMVAFDAARGAAPVPVAAPYPAGPGPRELTPSGEAAPRSSRTDQKPPMRISDATIPAPNANDPPLRLAPPLLDNFLAVADNGSTIPPDTMGAAGPNHLVVMLNSGFTVLSKTGAVLNPQVSLSSFWFALGTADGEPASRPFDPKILYDQDSDRWVAVSDGNPNCRDGTSDAWVLVGISETNSPSLGWFLYAIQANVGPDAGVWADFPGLGVDPNNVIVTNNMFTINCGGNSSFSHADVLVIDKAEMIAQAGASPLLEGSDFSRFHNPGSSGGFTFQPCHTFGQTPANAINYILDEGWSNGAQRFIRVKAITGVGASATLDNFGGADFIEVITYSFFVSDATQPGGCDPINTNDSRLLNAVWRNGKIWTTHAVGGTGFEAEVAWYEINPANVGAMSGAGVPNAQGRISDPTLAYYFPSIAVNRFECVALGFSGSDDNTFPGAYFTLHDPSVDGPGATQPVGLLKAGEDTYVKTFGSGRNRWGDYSATVIDPEDDTTFWTIQEYAADSGPAACNGTWSTWWGKFTCLANTGACCFNDGTCDPVSEADCMAQGGRFQGVNTQCANVVCPVSQVDGWLLSFHSDLPAGQNPDGFSIPLDLLGLYFCPPDIIDIQDTGAVGWDGHRVFEYFVELRDCHLLHSLLDDRPGASPPDPAQPEFFLETEDFIYWLDVQATVGHTYQTEPSDLFGSQPVGSGGSGVSRVWDIDVPGGPDRALPDQAISALSGLASVGTHLIGVTGNQGGGTIHEISFDGIEISSRAPTDAGITALSGASTAPANAAGFVAGHVYATPPSGNALWDLGLAGVGPDTLHSNVVDGTGAALDFIQGLAFDPSTGVLFASSFFPSGFPHLVTIDGAGLATDLGEIIIDGNQLNCGNVSGLAFDDGKLYGGLGGGGGVCPIAGDIIEIPLAAPGSATLDHSVTGGSDSIAGLAPGAGTLWIEIVTTSFAPDHFWGWHTSPDAFNDESVMGELVMGPNGEWLYQGWQVVDGTPHSLLRVDQAFELLTPDPPPPPQCPCLGDLDGNGVLDARDMQNFVDCLLGTAGPGINCACADMDGLGGPDINDIALFVSAVLGKAPCP